LHRNQGAFTISIFILGFCASLLATFEFSFYIPIVISLSALVAGINTFHGSSQRLMVTNQAIATLAGLVTQWLSMGNMDRRTPHFKEMLILKTEQCAMTVTNTAVGFSLLAEGEVDDDEMEGKAVERSNDGNQRRKKTVKPGAGNK